MLLRRGVARFHGSCVTPDIIQLRFARCTCVEIPPMLRWQWVSEPQQLNEFGEELGI